MSRGRQTFKQTDVTKAVKGMVKAGISLERVEIDKSGKIVMVPAKREDGEGKNPEENEWDVVLR
jgi:hypothetical protein